MIWGVTDIKRAPKGILRLVCERSGRISTGARARTTRANILFGGRGTEIEDYCFVARKYL